MINKIKELSIKTDEWMTEVNNWRHLSNGDNVPYLIRDTKFAELIAEECATICETASIPIDISVWQNSTKKEMTAVMALELAKLIRQKFGIE